MEKEKFEPKTLKKMGYNVSQIRNMLSDEELEIMKEKYNYDKYLDIYNNNPEYKKFVDKTCESYSFKLDFCLLIKTVREVGDYFVKKLEDHPDVVRTDICQCKLEDKSC